MNKKSGVNKIKSYIKYVVNKNHREKNEQFQQFQELFNKVLKIIPKHKKQYWLGEKLGKIHTLKGKIDLLKRIIKFEDKNNE